MPRNQVFISYSHKDTRWRNDLEIQLKPYLREGSITSWSDEQIVAGSQICFWFVYANRRNEIVFVVFSKLFQA